MSYEGNSRVVDVPLSDTSRKPDVVCCPHCRGTGVVLRKKLSPGQLRKSEQDEDELDTKRQRIGEGSGNNRSPPYFRRGEDQNTRNYSPGRQIEPWRRNETEIPSLLPDRDDASWKRNRQTDWKKPNFGPRRQNQNWREQTDDVWQDESISEDRFLESDGGPMSNKQRKQLRRRQRKRPEFDRMNNADSRFPSQYQSLIPDEEDHRYAFRQNEFNSPPLALMPPPASTATNQRPRPPANHPPRRRPRPGPGNRQIYPQDGPVSDVDLFSLGVIYGSCLQ